MKTQTFLQAAVLMACLGLAPASAQLSERADGVRFVPDVPGQFRALTERADALGFHRSTTPNPSMCRHYQGIARVDGADGTPFFLVTRSGNLPNFFASDIFCDDSPGETRNGHLIVFRMGSRDKHGERLRSNRLRQGMHVNATPPPPEDTATIYFTVVEDDLVFRDGEGGVPPRLYQHPGGMQVVGHMLALASEARRDLLAECIVACELTQENPAECISACRETIHYERATHPTLIMFFDVSNPEAPDFKSSFAPVDQHGAHLTGADGLAVTPLPGGLYLMAVTAGFEGEDPIFFYRSTSNNLASPELSWQYVGHTPGPNGDEDAHQSLHFLREGTIDGALYLAGARGHPLFGADHDKIDLYLVECTSPTGEPDPNCEPREGETIVVTTNRRGQPIGTFPSTGGNRLANLAAATGFHVTPSGELLFYATEHDNDGPSGTVKAGEWRHKDMVREGSPT
jgi:hypothetical protein